MLRRSMLEISGLRKTFPNGVVALDGVDLVVPKGEIVGVIGRSGTGKSTLIRCVNRLEEPTDGTIHLEGEDITRMRGPQLRAARRRIGMIFQQFNLLTSRTAAENVALPLEIAGVGRAERRRRALELLDLVGLGDRGASYPSQLSGGQKQRVGIARALASEPALLLSDEATSALDAETTNSVLDLLRRINTELGLTVLLITHEMDVVRRACDSVALLDAGTRRRARRARRGRRAARLAPGERPAAAVRARRGRRARARPRARPVRRRRRAARRGGRRGRPHRGALHRAHRRPARHARACRAPEGGRGMNDGWSEWAPLLWTATRETLVMVGVAMLVTIPFGLLLGVLLLITGRGGILEQPIANRILGAIVNVGRSVPFIILLVAVIPLTRALVGTTIGTTAAIVPLALATIPFFARIVETALREVPGGLVEAALAAGARRREIVQKVLIPEALPSLVSGVTITTIGVIGYSAMAGAVGGGGLGDVAIRYGYQRYETEVTIATVVVLVVLVQLLQFAGDFVARRLSHT